jgi:hypothetical protein
MTDSGSTLTAISSNSRRVSTGAIPSRWSCRTIREGVRLRLDRRPRVALRFGLAAMFPGFCLRVASRLRPWPGRLLECVFHRLSAPGGPAPCLGLLECGVAYAGAQRGQGGIVVRGAGHVGVQPSAAAGFQKRAGGG